MRLLAFNIKNYRSIPAKITQKAAAVLLRKKRFLLKEFILITAPLHLSIRWYRK